MDYTTETFICWISKHLFLSSLLHHRGKFVTFSCRYQSTRGIRNGSLLYPEKSTNGCFSTKLKHLFISSLLQLALGRAYALSRTTARALFLSRTRTLSLASFPGVCTDLCFWEQERTGRKYVKLGSLVSGKEIVGKCVDTGIQRSRVLGRNEKYLASLNYPLSILQNSTLKPLLLEGFPFWRVLARVSEGGSKRTPLNAWTKFEYTHTHNLALSFREVLCIAPSETRSRCDVVEFGRACDRGPPTVSLKNECEIHLRLPYKTSLPLN